MKGLVDVFGAESLPDDVLRIINRRLIAKLLSLFFGIATDTSRLNKLAHKNVEVLFCGFFYLS